MIVIFGKNGQIGGHLLALLGNKAVGLGHAEADVADSAAIHAALERLSPSLVINAAAYTQVDKAESEPELAQAVNGTAPGIVADYCATHSIPLIHYSTDYVFDGTGDTPWKEEDPTNPLSAYGRTKRQGEEAVIVSGCKYLIFRTSWVYDETGKNFLNTMLRLAAEREELRVVVDQHGAPTYAGDIALATMEAVRAAEAATEFPSGLYHLSAGGVTSWHGFATAIISEARMRGSAIKAQHITAITTSEYPTPAARPLFSALDCSKAKRVLGVQLPAWHEGLHRCMDNLYAR